MSQEPPIILGDGGSGPSAPVTSFVSITEDDLLQVIGDFITGILGNVQVAAGQDNRVPEPLGPDHVMMTLSSAAQLSSTTHANDPDAETITVARSTRVDVQLDVYGPNSFGNAMIITTLLRDGYGCTAMNGTGVQPLYCDDGRQMPLIDGEKQFEARWMIHASLQITPAIVTPAQFADSVEVVLIEADAP